jgi:hypothetical protein
MKTLDEVLAENWSVDDIRDSAAMRGGCEAAAMFGNVSAKHALAVLHAEKKREDDR